MTAVLGVASGLAYLDIVDAVRSILWALLLNFAGLHTALRLSTWIRTLVPAYRPMSFKHVLQGLDRHHRDDGSGAIIVGAASLFGWVLTTARVTEAVTEILLGISRDPLVLLLLINILLLIVGCFMETIAAISILVPVLMPAVIEAGIDPVQFGVIMVLNLMIGF